MMITSNQANEEVSRKHSSAAAGDIKAAVAASRQWSAQTESRIVRVSRVFGGKDRHSKVKTVKGLRDRRVRLSVPTAIQLYDLQDRLGLNQPSKVVDWLLNAARHEIDKLPPLQFPPQDFIGGHLPSSMPMLHEEKFSHCSLATSVGWNTNGEKGGVGAKGGGEDDASGRFPASYRFMGLNHALGMAGNSTVAPMAHHGSYNYTGESWNNTVHAESTTSPFPSMLSLAPGSHHHQLVFFSSEAEQFPAEDTNLGSQSLSLSSARGFHGQQGS